MNKLFFINNNNYVYHYGEKKQLIVFLLLCWSLLIISIETKKFEEFHNDDICSGTIQNNSKRRIYLDLGDYGYLSSANESLLSSSSSSASSSTSASPSSSSSSSSSATVTSSTQKPTSASNIRKPINANYQNKVTKIAFQCNLEIITCPSCRIEILLTFIDGKSSSPLPPAAPPPPRTPPTTTNPTDSSSILSPVPMNTTCDNDFFIITEMGYDNTIFADRICFSQYPLKYKTQTRSILIQYFYQENSTKNMQFKLDYIAKRNKDEFIFKPIMGRQQMNTLFGGGGGGDYRDSRERIIYDGIEIQAGANGINRKIMTSPFFPTPYPRDLIKEHLFTCNNNNLSLSSSSPTIYGSIPMMNNRKCCIRIIFTDFQLAFVSTMEFYDGTNLINVFTGDIFRPPIITTSTSSLLIKFYANGGNSIGYRAEISFQMLEDLNNNQNNIKDPSAIPVATTDHNNNQPQTIQYKKTISTDCGGYVETLGGAITMMNMIKNDTIESLQYYDCIWLIRPSDNYLQLKTHLSLHVETFQNFGDTSELTIRQGLTSIHPELQVLRWLKSATGDSGFTIGYELRDFVVPMSAGFYVKFKGVFTANSRLALVYTSFRYKECYVGTEFLCKNHKCIPIQLECDGFDNCGDSSDESKSCQLEWEQELFDRRWYSHTPNYYFPKVDRYPDLKTATFVFFISSIGLICLISALVILLYKTGSRARQQRELQTHLQTISELLDTARHDDPSTSDSPPEEPPEYEAPPDYDDVIKIGMENEIKHASKESASGSRRPSRSRSRRSSSQHFQNSILEVSLPPEEDTSTITMYSDAFLSPEDIHTFERSFNVIENESSSTSASSAAATAEAATPSTSTTSATTAAKGCQTNVNTIPQSPPPLYCQRLLSSSKSLLGCPLELSSTVDNNLLINISSTSITNINEISPTTSNSLWQTHDNENDHGDKIETNNSYSKVCSDCDGILINNNKLATNFKSGELIATNFGSGELIANNNYQLQQDQQQQQQQQQPQHSCRCETSIYQEQNRHYIRRSSSVENFPLLVHQPKLLHKLLVHKSMSDLLNL